MSDSISKTALILITVSMFLSGFVVSSLFSKEQQVDHSHTMNPIVPNWSGRIRRGKQKVALAEELLATSKNDKQRILEARVKFSAAILLLSDLRQDIVKSGNESKEVDELIKRAEHGLKLSGG